MVSSGNGEKKLSGLGNKLKEKLHLGGSTTVNKPLVYNAGGQTDYSPMRTSNQAGQQSGVKTTSQSSYSHSQQPHTVPGTLAPVEQKTPAQTPAEEGSRIAQRVPQAVEYEDTPGASTIAGARPLVAPYNQQHVSGDKESVPAAQETRQLPPGQYDEGARNDTLGALGVDRATGGHPYGAHHTSTGDLSSTLAGDGDINLSADQVVKNNVSPDICEKLATSGAAPGGPSGEAGEYGAPVQRRQESGLSGTQGAAANNKEHINRDLSEKMAGSGIAPGGPTGEREGLANTKPNATNPGFSTNGANEDESGQKGYLDKASEATRNTAAAVGTQVQELGQSGQQKAQQFTSGGEDINDGGAAGQTGYIARANEATRNTAAAVGTQAQQLGQITQQKAQELGQITQQKASEMYNTVGETLQSYGITKENAQKNAAAAGEKAKEVGQAVASQAGAQLEQHGITKETAQQKFADATETVKQYGLASKERAAEVLQQAANQMSAAGSQDENRNIVLQIFGAVALIWLAFGFSLMALVSLGVAGVVAAVLSRFSQNRVNDGTADRISSTGPQRTTDEQTETTSNTPAYETHYPNAASRDNTLKKM